MLLIIKLYTDKTFLPARRIGQRWGATRAPRPVTEVWRLCLPVQPLYFQIHTLVYNALNPRGLGGQRPPNIIRQNSLLI